MAQQHIWKRGEPLRAEWLNSISDTLHHVLVGGNGVRITRMGKQHIVDVSPAEAPPGAPIFLVVQSMEDLPITTLPKLAYVKDDGTYWFYFEEELLGVTYQKVSCISNLTSGTHTVGEV